MFTLLGHLHFLILFQQTKPKVYPKRTILERVWLYLGQAYDSVLEAINDVFSPRNIAQSIKGMILMLIIIVMAKIVLTLIRILVRAWIRRKERKAENKDIQRAKTIGTLFSNLAKYVIVIIAVILTLQGFNVDLTAIIASVGIVGLAIGFGAQTLVKDIISGFFILFEGDLAVGDDILFNGQIGTVEAIGVRSTKVRGFNGELRVIPNGDLATFGNLNRGYMKAIVVINLSYEASFKQTFPAIELLAQEFYRNHPEEILESPDVQGIVAFGASSVDVRVIFKTKPMIQNDIERRFRSFLKEEFEKRKIEIPFPRQVVYYRKDNEPLPMIR